MTAPQPAASADESQTPAAAPQRELQYTDWPVAARVLESVQTLLTALLLAFVFRAFFVEAFIIPTGSMAPALLGRHGTCVCAHCGWEFDYGPAPGQQRAGSFTPPAVVRCPNCHRDNELTAAQRVARAGDRILVHKWPYLLGGLLGPARWDVIVFRDPRNPEQNYIKRLVALPGETIEIIDGDVFIKPPDGGEFRVARKPPAAQAALWFPVFDQNHVPPGTPLWSPQSPESAPGWQGLDRRVIGYQPPDARPRTIRFAPAHSTDYLKDVYGYNQNRAANYVGDLRLVGEVTAAGSNGWWRWELTRDDRWFAAHFAADGTVRLLTRNRDGSELTLATAKLGPLADGRPRQVEFGHLDYRVYVKVAGRERLATTDEQYAPRLDELRQTRRVAPPRLRFTVAGLTLAVRGLRIDRDVYYCYDPRNTQRAYPGHPFRLGPDEYFVLGDNSPNSADSREWYRVGVHLRRAWQEGRYQLGTVRADQIVGRAFFVYLPGLLPLSEGGGWRVPDLGRVRFVR